MAGRARVVRLKQSLVNSIDNSTFSGPMKMGTPPSIGKIKYYWHNYLYNCNTNTAYKCLNSKGNQIPRFEYSFLKAL